MSQMIDVSNASAGIWDWKATAPSSSAPPAGLSPRMRGLLQGSLTVLVAAMMWRFELRHMAMVAGGMGTLVIVLALVSPSSALAALHRAVQWVGNSIGRALGGLLLVLVFYFFFVPFGALFRRARHDTLKRYYEPDAPTYWDTRPAALVRSRGRQF